jgi:phosphoserine phosphatase
VSATPFDEIWFDCDSTLCAIEGIDVLAEARPDRAAAVAELTRAAMAGELPLEAAYGRRLHLVAPTRSEVDAVGLRYVETLVPGAKELVAALLALKKRTAIVSGGLRRAVLAAARELAIPEGDVFAVDVTFDADGRYAGFDAASPLARRGGKIEVLRAARRSGRAALIGTGSTDPEAACAVDLFVGCGVVAARPAVKDAATVYLEGPSLAPLLDVLTTKEERTALSRLGGFEPLQSAAAAHRASLRLRHAP